MNRPQETTASFFGLIAEPQFHRSELHGFEVEMNGTVIAPEFRPGRVQGALPALMAFASDFLAAMDEASKTPILS
jgi:hypothetical protein